MVHLQHATIAGAAVVGAIGLRDGAFLAEAWAAIRLGCEGSKGQFGVVEGFVGG